jgi:hypothetical protein
LIEVDIASDESVMACADVARTLRCVNIALGLALAACAFAFADGTLQLVASLACAAALALLALPRGHTCPKSLPGSRWTLRCNGREAP